MKECLSINHNRSYSLGTRECTQKMCTLLSLDEVIRPLKEKGVDLYSIFQMLIAFRMISNNKDFSIRQFVEWCNNPDILDYYGIDNPIIDKTIYRAVEILGKNLRVILHEIQKRVNLLLPLPEAVYLDWTTIVLWGFKSPLGEYGYSRDKRNDKQQITIGASITSAPYCIPIGMTVEAGSVCDIKHFTKTLDQIAEELGKGTLIVFDKGPASKDNLKELENRGFTYLTGMKFNKSIDEQIKNFCKSESNCINPDAKPNQRIYYLKIQYEHHTNFIYFSEQNKLDALDSIRKSAEKKYEEALKLRAREIRFEKQKRRGRKRKSENDFIIVTRTTQAQLIDDIPKEEAIDMAIKRYMTGREGFFVLTTNKNLTAEEALTIYREKDAIEKLFYSLKNEIPLGPLRSWKENNVKGVCLIAYLAHLFLALTRLFIPELKHISDKILIYSLKNLTETFVYKGKKLVKKIISNIDTISSAILNQKFDLNCVGAGG